MIRAIRSRSKQVKKFGLVLGGGGVVGIAWEVGVAAGLHEAFGFDAREAAVVVGSSAGSAAGALLTLGRPMEELVAQQRHVPANAAPRPPQDGAGGGTSVVPEAIMRELLSREGTIEERARRIGPMAVAAPVTLSEDAFVASFVRMFGTEEWPETDLRATTADCEDGASVLLGKESGVDLARAVAASCAIPGFFPPISVNGRRYMDGPRGGFYPSLVKEKGLEAVVFIGPVGALPEGLRSNPEMDELERMGIPMARIEGGAGLASLGADLMDISARARAVDAGILDGRAAAEAVARVLA